LTLVAGVINSVAGGGTLVSFPALVAVGVPSLHANVTNTVALGPGYLGAALAQRGALQDNRHRLRTLLPVAGAGGLVGSILLVATSQRLFDMIVPFLILLACGLLGFQDRIKAKVFGHQPIADPVSTPTALVVAVFATAIYGGYFGAGIGILMLAALGLVGLTDIHRMNAVKVWGALLINVVAAALFAARGVIDWPLAGAMATGALLGGYAGSRLAQRIGQRAVRGAVIVIGLLAFAWLLLRD